MTRPRGGSVEVRWYRALRSLRDLALAPLAAPLVRLGVAPWAVSLAGVAAAACTFFLLPDHSGPAVAVLALALGADSVDGAVARRGGHSSGRGKLVDQACDAATFVLLALAAGTHGLARTPLAAAAAVACTLAVALALVTEARRDPVAFRAHPRAGFWAHLPKLPFLTAYPLVLLGLGGREPGAFLDSALMLSTLLGTLVVGGWALAPSWTRVAAASPRGDGAEPL